MKKIIITIVVLIIIALGIYFISSNKIPKGSLDNVVLNNVDNVVPNTTDNTTTTPTVSNPIQAPALKEVTINISNFSFNPSTVNIKVGTKVTWINDDSMSHTVTSDSGSLLNSQSIAKGESFSFTFNNIGTTKYHCSIHPSMKGAIVVEK